VNAGDQAPMTQKSLSDFESSGVECPTCGERFSENGVAAHHWQAHGEKLRENVECENCGAELSRKPSNIYSVNFCDEECKYDYRTGEQNWNYNSVKRECSYCGGTCERMVSHLSEHGPFCNRDCYAAWLSETRSGKDNPNWEREEVNCDNCGQVIYIKQCRFEKNDQNYCSTDCRVSHVKKNSHAHNRVSAVRRKLSSSTWTTIARNYRDKVGPECEWGGDKPEGRKHDVHHIVPVRCGGTNNHENLILVCRMCHTKMESFVSNLPEFETLLVE